MGGMSNTGRKYSLTFSAQALNLFNDIDYGTPVGSVTSPSFGRSVESSRRGLFDSVGGAPHLRPGRVSVLKAGVSDQG